MKDSSVAMTNEQMVANVKAGQKRIRYRDTILSVCALLLFLIIWECLVMFELVEAFLRF